MLRKKTDAGDMMPRRRFETRLFRMGSALLRSLQSHFSWIVGYFRVWAERADRQLAERISGFVDHAFYLQANPDVVDSGMDPALHYVKHGWREGRDPSPGFSTRAYLAANPDVVRMGINPLLHFIERGAPQETEPSREEIALVATEFDRGFYRRRYDVPDTTDPVVHFCSQGWRAGFDPSPAFSTRYYLTTNVDVRESGVNPFWHYLVAGREEGRAPSQPGGWRFERIASQQPLQKTKEDWLRRDKPPRLIGSDELTRMISAGCTGQAVLVSIGHDDYRKTQGGVQLCIALEAARAVETEHDYLNLQPWQPLPTLAELESDPILAVVLNGETLGHVRTSTVIGAVKDAPLRSPRIVCHHLMGHNPELLIDLAEAMEVSEAHFWLHDNFTICPSYALQRNDVTFCGAPDPQSNACHICLYGHERRSHVARVRRLFESLAMHVVAPSDVALAFWTARSGLPSASVSVHPHVQLMPTMRKTPANPTGRYRIAFIGMPAPHKGWPIFERLHAELSGDERYEFLMFSSHNVAMDVTQVPIQCTADNPTGTITALKDHGVDLVLHWATCLETFSFSTYEAMAAGAFVVTNEGSGNVAAAVRTHDRGLVLSDPEELFRLARAGDLAMLAEQARARRAEESIDVAYSNFILDKIATRALAA